MSSEKNVRARKIRVVALVMVTVSALLLAAYFLVSGIDLKGIVAAIHGT